jgi:hypothetical protein
MLAATAPRRRTMQLMQFEFPLDGPWGDDAAAAFGDLASYRGHVPSR